MRECTATVRAPSRPQRPGRGNRVSAFIDGMPVPALAATALYGAASGLLTIGWIVVNAVFRYNLTVRRGNSTSSGRPWDSRSVQS